MNIRISLGTVLAALIFAAIGAGTAVGVMLWEPWDAGDTESPISTPPYQRRLTGAEAAAIVYDRENERLSADSPGSALIYFSCEADDFNERLKTWIVVCKFGVPDVPALDITFRLYDETEEIENLLLEDGQAD